MNDEGDSHRVTDRAGRTWQYANYQSRSGPAFWLELPEEFWPPGTGNYACHFDGNIGMTTAQHVTIADLRVEFIRLLTKDSETHDRRRREFNQALFMPDGKAVWSATTLSMILSKFEKAVSNLEAARH